MPDLQSFIDRWKASGASERANFPSFVVDLCDLLHLARSEASSSYSDPPDPRLTLPITPR